jgi:hypothetical protein
VLAVLAVDASAVVDPLPETVTVGVPVGISEDGTAEIGAGAGLPAAGGQKVRV